MGLLASTKDKIVDAKQLAESVTVEKQRLIESAKRASVLNELTAPLSKDQKDIMSDLLESVQTPKLRAAFDKYLPTVIDGNTPAKKKALTEGKEITGNREEMTTNSRQAEDNNVVDIRRLAGL